MTFLQNFVNAAAEIGVDQSKAKEGGDRQVYPEGPVKLRFVGYAEIGRHLKKSAQFGDKVKNLVRLTFEVSGPKHPPLQTENGPKPLLVHEELMLSLDKKAGFHKLFSLLNHDRSATHCAHLLGRAYTGRLVHRRYKRASDPADPASWTGLEYQLRQDSAYTIRPPFREDPDTGDVVPVDVPPPLTTLHGFLWDNPSIEQWDSIFIPGEFPERRGQNGELLAPAKSKNLLQERIMQAVNFKGSPIHTLLLAQGKKFDIPAHGDAEPEDSAPEETPKKAPGSPATPRTGGGQGGGSGKPAAKAPAAGADDFDAFNEAGSGEDDIPW